MSSIGQALMTPTMSASATAKQSEDQLAKVQAFQEIEHDDNKHKIFVQQHLMLFSNTSVNDVHL